MNGPLLTVYITNYNYEAYIKQAIESVLNQSFQDFELLIIDDGSTDNSRDIIESYKDHEQITIIYQQNKGLNVTNNIALRLSNGKYIMRLDADDYLTSDALEKMTGLLESDVDLGMVFPDYYLVDASNQIMAEIKRHDFNDEVTLLDQPAHGACTVIRTDFLRTVGGYDESYSCQDGYELWIKFSTKYKVLNVREPLFYYRRHGQNLTTNENRILGTRRSINRNFILNNEIELPKTLGILPLRGKRMKGQLLALIEMAGQTLIERKVSGILASRHLDHLVITVSDADLLQAIQPLFADEDRVTCVERPRELARPNISLQGTIENCLVHPAFASADYEAAMVLPIEFPFIDGEYIDDALHALVIFNADALISVRQESNIFYQHRGSGMEPILDQNKFTRLERESLYKGIGGITLTRLAGMRKHDVILHGKVGHVVVDQQAAMGIHSGFDLQLIRLLMETVEKPV
ncbi:MAG: glycosyltransferase [Bacteroidota bacterium]